MKYYILFLTAFLSFNSQAQEVIEKSIGDFTELKVYDLIQVELIKSDKNAVAISGNNSSKVETLNKNGTLKVRMSIDNSFNGEKTKVKVYYKALEVIDVNEGASVTSGDTIEQFEIDLRAQEGGTIEIPVKVSYAVIKSITGGEITTSGQAKTEQITIYTGGIYNGEDLESETVNVSIHAAGEAHVRASKLMDIVIRAGGDVYVYGNPETVNENKVLGGRILRVD
ncbi:head GIN domain-containing protein [Formosa sp. A9]|uniref:head GIN domain-containing protein n=1 Tax=Formosa sp. A9 TaxID=3442641 RepID=UPI003EC054F6